MKKKRLGLKHFKTENDKIFQKTDIILQSMKNKIRQQLKAKKLELDHPFKMIRQLNQDYSQLLQHRQLRNNIFVDIQLIRHTQEFFAINIQQVTFPIYLHLKNVSTQGIAYVGYNIQFPGIDLNNYQGTQQWDFKYQFSQDRLIKLLNPKRKNVKVLYITILPKNRFLTLSMKVAFYQEQIQKDSPNIKGHKIKKNFILPSMKNKNKIFQQIFESIKKSDSPKTSRIIDKPSRLQKRNISQKNLKNTLFKNEMNTSLNLLKKQNSLINIARVKDNLVNIEQVKEKNRKIKQEANKCKQLIADYKEKFLLQSYQKKKLNKCLSPLLIGCLFCFKANYKYDEKVHSIDQAFFIRMHINTFIKRIKKNYQSCVQIIPFSRLRNQIGLSTFLELEGKFLHQGQKNRASKTIHKVIHQLKPCLIISELANKCQKYNQNAMKIQKYWKLRYKTRMMIFKNYVRRHVRKMVKNYTYLKQLQNQYYEENCAHKMIYQYWKEETLKYRNIYAQYKQKLKQLLIYEKKKQQLQKKKEQKNKKITKKIISPHKKQKVTLQVPQKPQKPKHRFFRDIDVLKAMIRGWFQLEYKKIKKRNQLY